MHTSVQTVRFFWRTERACKCETPNSSASSVSAWTEESETQWWRNPGTISIRNWVLPNQISLPNQRDKEKLCCCHGKFRSNHWAIEWDQQKCSHSLGKSKWVQAYHHWLESDSWTEGRYQKVKLNPWIDTGLRSTSEATLLTDWADSKRSKRASQADQETARAEPSTQWATLLWSNGWCIEKLPHALSTWRSFPSANGFHSQQKLWSAKIIHSDLNFNCADSREEHLPLFSFSISTLIAFSIS